MAIALSTEIRGLVDRTNFAHFATLLPDGSPHSDTVWIAREANRVVVCTSETTFKAKNTRRDPRVAISIVDFDDPYNEAQLRGRVVEHRPDPDLKAADLVSRKYTDKPFPMRSPEGRVALIIEIDKARHLKIPFKHEPRKTGPA